MPTSSASSTSPSTPTITTGKCVVCGKETYLRCEACSRFGTDWMFFCSVEHQRLIWKVHRFVCGPRSNPFTFPGFSEYDLEKCKSLARNSIEKDGQSDYLHGKSAIEIFTQELDGPEDLQTKFEIVTRNLKDRGIVEPFSFRSQLVITHVRAALARTRAKEIHDTPNPEVEGSIKAWRAEMRKSPFNCLAQDVLKIDEKFSAGEGPEWMNEYLHRRLIDLYLFGISDPDSDDHPYSTCESGLLKFVMERVGIRDPESARKIVASIGYVGL